MERLIGAAILAPSAMNLQPWVFAVLLDGERINNCAHRAKDWLLANVSQVSASAAGSRSQILLFYHAPPLVIILAKSSDDQALDPQAIEDCLPCGGELDAGGAR